jgi:isoamylase
VTPYVPLEPTSWAAATWPLGPIPSGDVTTFAVHAPNATRVVLEFYDEPVGVNASFEVECARGVDGAWRAKVAGATHGTLYAYRCWGPNWPYVEAWSRGDSGEGFDSDIAAGGDRFNPNKVLFDPYAREITHNGLAEVIEECGGDQGVFGTGCQVHRGRPRRELDTGRYAPKGIVIVNSDLVGERPKAPPEKATIYEAHVKNLTMHPSASRLSELLGHCPGFEQVVDVPEQLRGTYKGAGMLAPYLRALGLTTIELLPVHETNTSEKAQRDQTANHWGYQTLSYFAPNRDYAYDKSPGGPTAEFKAMVKAFHDAGIEVYLDVVYNHTAEGGHWEGDREATGFVSLGGFATTDYYVLDGNDMLIDGATGCSNQLNASSEATQRLVLDSLAYYGTTMGVDGFRFDLAPVLGRRPADAPRDDWDLQRRFFPDHELLSAIAHQAEDHQVEVIAEAWDLWGYEVGNFPEGWGEWNGRYRDAVRDFCKGTGDVHEFMDMLNGDYAHFHEEGAGSPARSINFITAHDGFTMMDLVSYNEKNNDIDPPFGPSDGGSDDNKSWDSGGDHGLRRQRLRNFLAVLFLSKGVPMLVAGDEYGRTQNGNNNPWALNTIGMWANYAQAASNAPMRIPVDPEHPDDCGIYYDVFGEAGCSADMNPVFMFATYLSHLRQRNRLLRPDEWGSLSRPRGKAPFEFTGADGANGPVEGDQALGFRIHAEGAPGNHGDLFVLINMTPESVDFVVPPAQEEREWRRLIDTYGAFEWCHNCWRPEDSEVIHDAYAVQEWSVVVLEATPVLGTP